MGPLLALLGSTLTGGRSRRSSAADGLELATIDVLRLDDAGRAALRSDLIAVMESATEAAEAREHFSPRAYLDRALDPRVHDRFNAVLLARDGGRPVGFMAAQARRERVLGREVEVLSAVAQVDPAYQGRGVLGLGFIGLALRYARTRLVVRCPRYFVGVCLNPAVYYFIRRRAPRMFPGPLRPEDPVMAALCERRFPAAERDEGVVHGLRAPILDARVRAWIDRTADPLVAFYLARNPRYAEGRGLPFAIPLGVADFVCGTALHAWLTVTRPLRRRGP